MLLKAISFSAIVVGCIIAAYLFLFAACILKMLIDWMDEIW